MSTRRRRAPARRAPVRRRRTVNGSRQVALTGRGDYAATKRAYNNARKNPAYQPSLGRSLLEGGGELIGSAFGVGSLGKTAGKHLSHLFGLGDYQVKENVFLHGRLPEMVNLPAGGGTVIRFQEYLGDVITSPTANTFDVQSYIINPANNETFPWLSQLAANYEQYSFEGLIFEFRSTSADALNSVNTALGTVMMATQYDVADGVFSSKAEMLNYEFSNSIKPSENCLHMIECAPRQTTLTELYTNAGQSVPAGLDPRFYNLGRFQIATSGFQGTNVTVGELHVTYQVRLIKPKLYDGLGNDAGLAHFNCVSVGSGAAFGTDRDKVYYNNLGVTFDSNNVLRIPSSSQPRKFLIMFYTTLVGAGSVLTLTASLVGATSFGAGFLKQPPAGSPDSFAWEHHVQQIVNQDIVLTMTMTYANPVNGFIRVIELPQSVTA